MIDDIVYVAGDTHQEIYLNREHTKPQAESSISSGRYPKGRANLLAGILMEMQPGTGWSRLGIENDFKIL